jgi:hypothetical protein
MQEKQQFLREGKEIKVSCTNEEYSNRAEESANGNRTDAIIHVTARYRGELNRNGCGAEQR